MQRLDHARTMDIMPSRIDILVDEISRIETMLKQQIQRHILIAPTYMD